MTSHNSASLTNTMAKNTCRIGQHRPATIWTALMAPFSRHTSPRTPRCMCTTKICAVCCHWHSKRKSTPKTVCPATVSRQAKRCSPPSITIQTTFASVQPARHVHHTECSMCPPVNTVSLIYFPFQLICGHQGHRRLRTPNVMSVSAERRRKNVDKSGVLFSFLFRRKFFY